MGRNFLAFRISNFIDTKLKFEMVWYGLDLWYKSYWNIQQLWFIINLVKSKLKLSGRFWWDLGVAKKFLMSEISCKVIS
jgi:hypothetical protein